MFTQRERERKRYISELILNDYVLMLASLWALIKPIHQVSAKVIAGDLYVTATFPQLLFYSEPTDVTFMIQYPQKLEKEEGGEEWTVKTGMRG